MADFRSELANKLVSLMGSGLSFEASCAELGLAPSTARYWEKAHPEWADARELGNWKHLAFYEKLLASSATGILPKELAKEGSKGVNTGSVQFALARKHPEMYGADRITSTDEKRERDLETIERLENEIKAKLERFGFISDDNAGKSGPVRTAGKTRKTKGKAKPA